MMPLRSGIDFCREIKANIKTSHIPFVLLTAKTTIDDQIAGIATGADVYLTKPFSMRFLLTHVNQIIESRQKLYARFSQDVYLMPGKVASNEIDQAFLQKAIDFIVANIQDPQLGVDSIADLFNLSRMQVYRKVKALTGKSVVEFIRMVRMKQALKLMDTHKYTLSEVAYQAGFNSSSYFTRCFKEEFGKTPSEYLQQA
jgi:AraC-like DNA-binding protein